MVLARLDFFHINTHATFDRHAKIGGPARHMCSVGAGDKCFGWRAAGVDAGAAELVALDDGNLHTSRRKTAGQRWSGLTRTDDDGVKLRHVALLPFTSPMKFSSFDRGAPKCLRSWTRRLEPSSCGRRWA